MRGTLAWLTGGLALLTLAADTSAAAKPGLLVTHFQPLTVLGTGFEANERVVVTVVLGKDKHVRSVRAGTRGRFRVRFDVGGSLRCGPLLKVSAYGVTGSRAAARLPQPQCPPDRPVP